jgi:uncharacterized protein YprB with RNaseH-like and TPR domain
MVKNLKTRLRRYRDTGKTSATAETERFKVNRSFQEEDSWSGWTEAGFKTLKRELLRELSLPLPGAFAGALAILVPDLLPLGRIPKPQNLLFFDLETTGLSGGAGTVAFLAAFGRFVVSGSSGNVSKNARLAITQYLLLDYPGEGDFIDNTVKEFAPLSGNGSLPLVVSYNGKSFDSQILKTRCLMNGIRAPEYFHADLLHPSRHLWKSLLPDCSQKTIEVSVLGLDRAGDVPGALAPEIWFSFLRREGNPGGLLSLCDHNAKDITGLATLFLALGEIAADPFKSRNIFKFDEEALAFSWIKALKRNPGFFRDAESRRTNAETGDLLLENAAKKGYPKAAFALALALLKKGRDKEGRSLLQKIAGDGSLSGSLRAAALMALAKDAEWRSGNPAEALDYTNSALDLSGEIPGSFRKELEKRRMRLEGKTVSIQSAAGYRRFTGSTSISR